MKPLLLFVAALPFALVPVLQEAAPASPDPERGKYLVHHVAMCVQCHSPRDEAGDLDRTRLLTGAPIPVASPFRGDRWAVRAPSLAGMPGYTDEEMVRLLTEGVNRNGHQPLAPMPPFRMQEEDARAVAAYLRTLR